MKITLIAKTMEEKTGVSSTTTIEDLKTFAGKQAGICYMKDAYFGTYVTDEQKANARFSKVAATGHHSIADHCKLTFLLEEIPKILAMYLNNMRCYDTSEKSGRYTEMRGSTEVEREKYTKWITLFKYRLTEEYGDLIDDGTKDKLAKENARYLLSVFTPTTMSYTTSLRQWNYIVDWMEKENFADLEEGYFKENIKKIFEGFLAEIKPQVYVEGLRDTKKGRLTLINNARVCSVEEEYGSEMYVTKYLATFPAFGQAQRHRTLKYAIGFDGLSKSFYVPEIIKGTELEEEWLSDMEAVQEYVPQGTLVMVMESGDYEDFFLKCKERLCGRAQIEIAKQTQETVQHMYANRGMLSGYCRDMLRDYVDAEGNCKTKCMLLKCKEPCVWGSKNCFTRKI